MYHVIFFLNKFVSKGVIDMKFSPDVGTNASNPHIQINQFVPNFSYAYDGK